jgi:hypothetical protein
LKKISVVLSFLVVLFSQESYWQQHADYNIDIKLNVKNHTFTGKEKLVYTNNSPDTLHNVFYHLYFNAFQPGSMMDVRSRSIADADPRVKDRISKLKKDEIGKQNVSSLSQDGKSLKYKIVGTILEVKLENPILPGQKSTFEMEFDGQVPLQIRRSGRDNKEGISYSMAQWYPKMSEYDEEGWHSNPYIGREFHGIWGNFNVNITLDATYIIAGTGLLQNADKIGYGYSDNEVKHSEGTDLTWNFKADNVHDFVWAADPDYQVNKAVAKDGVTFYFVYQPGEKTQDWEQLPEKTIQAYEYLSKRFGAYPYKQYSVIQGGDGGMEYPMATLITGHRKIKSLVGVTVHEYAHTLYQMLLATNEAKYAWMDEGFTSFASSETMNHLYPSEKDPHGGSFRGYHYLNKSGDEEPLSTHADHFNKNRSYSISSYSKGSVFLNQLSYVIGQETFDKAFRTYFETWKFKHPNPRRLKRIMEKESGIELDWYFEYMVSTTKSVDYAIKTVFPKDGKTYVVLERKGLFPMPIDLEVEFDGGKKHMFYAPLVIMRGEKENENSKMKRTVLKDWPWVNPTYTIVIDEDIEDIKRIEIDPSQRLADIDRENNTYDVNMKNEFEFFGNK